MAKMVAHGRSSQTRVTLLDAHRNQSYFPGIPPIESSVSISRVSSWRLSEVYKPPKGVTLQQMWSIVALMYCCQVTFFGMAAISMLESGVGLQNDIWV
ncbi:hypothetical protein HETIRDRAFT_171378 [Heterobasidion irregulare TC 32-1]|uniref:Uncharacterized protein n=1 Tax=Heterobasidion irregulare (strain TC 32-1) TaxID=747525 RepID=W4K2T9_HETIT|nr:uncharacterized protein HETIRDRAFT_171378 [Heterobasidion irregulare TC 32-1]ETW80132.1 hypothetical protein HETIRDRAFT_171378 [Heterobasidion irregulare TC 32-1]